MGYNINKMEKNNYVYLYIFAIIINMYVLYHLRENYKNKDCECARNTQSRYILAYTLTTLALASVLVVLYYSKRFAAFAKWERIWDIFIIPASIVYYYMSYKYIRDLQEKHCNCIPREQLIAFKYLTGIVATLFSISGVIFLLGIIGVGLLYTRKRS